jgi:AraC-like DNA-binding protein/Tfp pilus assembly protein PilF
MRFLLVLILIEISSNAFSQTRMLDSLYTALENHPAEDTVRVKIMFKICYRESAFHPEKNKILAEQALKISNKIKFTRGIGNANRYLADYYHEVGDYPMAIRYAFQMLKAFESISYNVGVSQSYQFLGLLYNAAGDFDKASLYYTRAISVCQQANLKKELSYCYNNLAGLNFSLSKFDIALENYLKSLAIKKEINDAHGITTSQANIASVYVKLQKFDKAKEYFDIALANLQRSTDQDILSNVYESLGEMYLLEGEYAAAEISLLKAVEFAKAINNKKLLQSTHGYLSELERKKGDFKKALVYAELSAAYRDSIYTVDKAREIANTEARYETAKKDQQIQLLEQDKKMGQLWTNILIGGFALVIMALISIYYVRGVREKKNRKLLNHEIDYLTNQHKELAEKFKNVLSGENDDVKDSQDQRILKKAIEVIEMNIHDPLFGVEKMSREMAMSRTNMHRKIKAITGFPPSELIRNIRLRKAAALILNRVDTVSNISFMVGFEDQSYFSKSFKKQFGVPPSEYHHLKANGNGEVMVSELTRIAAN